jgi:hypothetical protein
MCILDHCLIYENFLTEFYIPTKNPYIHAYKSFVVNVVNNGDIAVDSPANNNKSLSKDSLCIHLLSANQPRRTLPNVFVIPLIDIQKRKKNN